MRWQIYGHEEWNDMSEDIDNYSLKQLGEMRRRAKEHLLDLRDSEPSSKRKNEEVHRVWFAQCQQVIQDLNQIDLAISRKHDQNTETEIDYESDGMTYEDLMKDIEVNQIMREAYKRGEIGDGMSYECRQNWIEKCNS